MCKGTGGGGWEGWTQDTDTVGQGFLTYNSQIEFQSTIFLAPQNELNNICYLVNTRCYTPKSLLFHPGDFVSCLVEGYIVNFTVTRKALV